MAIIVQSVILSKRHYPSREEAAAWVREHGLKDHIHPDPNPDSLNYHRFRQVQPSKFVPDTFRTRQIGAGVSLVLGRLKG